MTTKLRVPVCGETFGDGTCIDGWVTIVSDGDDNGDLVRRCPCRFATSPERERDIGVQAVIAAREAQFTAAKKVIADHAAVYETFNANDVRYAMDAAGIESKNVIGAAFLACRDAGLIEATALTVRSTDPGTHAHRLTVWRVTREISSRGSATPNETVQSA